MVLRKATTLLFGVVAVVVLAGSPAFAGGPDGEVRLLPLKVSSNRLSAEDIGLLTQAVLDKIAKYPKFKALAVPEQDPMDLMVDAECVDFDAECLATIGKQAGANKVLYTEVTETDGRFNVQMRFVDVVSMDVQAPDGAIESRDKLNAFVGSALERVFGPEPAPKDEPVKVELATNPAGSEVYIDKDFVGLTPVMLTLKPGEYQVRFTKVGFQETRKNVVIEQSKSAKLAYDLVKIDVPPVPIIPEPAEEPEQKVVKTPYYQTWWFWTVVGVVVAGAGVTAALLTVEDDGGNGTAGFTPDQAFAPRDVTLYQ